MTGGTFTINQLLYHRDIFEYKCFCHHQIYIQVFSKEKHYCFRLDLCIASLHAPCCTPGTIEENTNAYIEAMKNPYIHILGHPDDGRYPIDYERLVKAAKEYDIALELNNSSLSPTTFRINARENAITYLKLCKEYSVPVVLGSDAHCHQDIANFPYALEALRAANYPRDLVLNTSTDKFLAYLKSRSAK